jgi:hypothetical protein
MILDTGGSSPRPFLYSRTIFIASPSCLAGNDRAPRSPARGAWEIGPACPLWRVHFPGENDARCEGRMNTREMSRRRRQRRTGGATCMSASRFSCSNFEIFNFKFRFSGFTSTRQCFQVESAATHSKQTIGVRATRQFFEGSPKAIFEFRISSFALSVPKKGVNQNHVFLRASRSQQTSAAQKGCQFFAVLFSSLVTADSAALKAATLHENLCARHRGAIDLRGH